MLASAAALIGGQALAPTPAFAVGASGAQTCSNVTWFDQFKCIVDSVQNNGGGIGGGGGSAGATPGTGRPGEVIFTSGVAPNPKCQDPGVFCVSIGIDRPGRPDPDSKPRGEGPGRGHQPQPEVGRPSCTRPSKGKEAGVCPDPPGKPQKPKDPLLEALEQAKICGQIQARLRKYRRYRREIDTGQIAGGPIFEDSPATRQEFRELMDSAIEIEEQAARSNQCHLQLQT